MHRIAITKVTLFEHEYIAYIVLDENREFVDFQLYAPDSSQLNQIYIGRVENIVANINAAFIKISANQLCYLSLEDFKNPIFTKKQSNKKQLSIGDELLVQVTKDALKSKDPVVSTKINLSGKYCVLTSDSTSLHVSKKIKGEPLSKFQDLFVDYKQQALEYNFGVIIRTNASQVSLEDVKADMDEVISRFIDLKTTAIHQNAFMNFDNQDSFYIQKIKKFNISNLDAIYTDIREIHKELEAKLPYLVEKQLLKFYDDSQLSLNVLYNINGRIHHLLEKHVWLKSGANIIIEQLETLTFIDVNSAKNIAKKEDAILAINIEAAKEISTQLQLRNISGMILIDFINMKSEEHKETLIAKLKEFTKADSVPCNFIDITKLGLIELTRKKTYKSLKEIIEK